MNIKAALVTTFSLLLVAGCDVDDDPADADEAEDGGSALAVRVETFVGDEPPLLSAGPGEVTFIHLSDAEMRRIGDEDEGPVVSGLLVLPGALSAAEIAEVKASLVLSGEEPPVEEEARDALDLAVETDPQFACTGRYLTNVASLGGNWYYPSEPIDVVVGQSPQVLHMSINKSIGASFTANVGVEASVVSAGVNYNVSGSYGVSSTTDWKVPADKYGKIEAFTMYYRHTWDIWYDPCFGADYKLGTGSSRRPYGVFFKTTAW